jgi:hypothetical protein
VAPGPAEDGEVATDNGPATNSLGRERLIQHAIEPAVSAM